MNIKLWMLQATVAVLTVLLGYAKIFSWEKYKADKWAAALGRGVVTVIGIFQILAGLGFILPLALNIMPNLTPLSGLGLIVLMLLFTVFHLIRKEKDRALWSVMTLVALALVTLLDMGSPRCQDFYPPIYNALNKELF